jgi:hypothetical protein
MAPKATGNKKTVKPGSTSQKRSSAASSRSGVQKAQPKRRRRSARTGRAENSDDEPITIGGSSNPIIIQKPTSYAERRRKRATLSMKDIYADSLKEDGDPKDYASKFAPGSTAEYTWGIATSQPVLAIERRRRHVGFRAFGLRRGRKSAFEKFMFGKNSEEEIEPFRFMDLPLEIRWEVYGYLLVRTRPILMQSEWRNVFITSTHDHTILLVSRQVSLESTRVLFERNVFQTYIGFKSGFSSLRMGTLAERFVSNFRNVIIECKNEDWMLPLINKIAICVGNLVKNGTVLNSLTIVISPLTAAWGPTHALSDIYDQTTFADFFEAPASKLMRIIPKLQLKILNAVIRLPENKRALISIDLRANPVNKDQSGWLAEDHVSQRSAKRHLAQLKKDLMGLKKRFEEVCENHEKAVLEGKARLLGKEESLSDGMRLAARGQECLSRGVSKVVIPSLVVGEQAKPLGPVKDEVLQPPHVPEV